MPAVRNNLAELKKALSDLEDFQGGQRRADDNVREAINECMFRIALHRDTALPEAIALLKKACRRDSSNPRYPYHLARAYALTGQLENAAKAATRAWELDPGSHRILSLIVCLQMELFAKYDGDRRYKSSDIKKRAAELTREIKNGRDDIPEALVSFDIPETEEYKKEKETKPDPYARREAAPAAAAKAAVGKRKTPKGSVIKRVIHPDACRWPGIYDIEFDSLLESKADAGGMEKLLPLLEESLQDFRSGICPLSAPVTSAVQWIVAGYPVRTVERLFGLLMEEYPEKAPVRLLKEVCAFTRMDDASALKRLAMLLVSGEIPPMLAAALHRSRFLWIAGKYEKAYAYKGARAFLGKPESGAGEDADGRANHDIQELMKGLAAMTPSRPKPMKDAPAGRGKKSGDTVGAGEAFQAAERCSEELKALCTGDFMLLKTVTAANAPNIAGDEDFSTCAKEERIFREVLEKLLQGGEHGRAALEEIAGRVEAGEDAGLPVEEFILRKDAANKNFIEVCSCRKKFGDNLAKIDLELKKHPYIYDESKAKPDKRISEAQDAIRRCLEPLTQQEEEEAPQTAGEAFLAAERCAETLKALSSDSFALLKTVTAANAAKIASEEDFSVCTAEEGIFRDILGKLLKGGDDGRKALAEIEKRVEAGEDAGLPVEEFIRRKDAANKNFIEVCGCRKKFSDNLEKIVLELKKHPFQYDGSKAKLDGRITEKPDAILRCMEPVAPQEKAPSEAEEIPAAPVADGWMCFNSALEEGCRLLGEAETRLNAQGQKASPQGCLRLARLTGLSAQLARSLRRAYRRLVDSPGAGLPPEDPAAWKKEAEKKLARLESGASGLREKTADCRKRLKKSGGFAQPAESGGPALEDIRLSLAGLLADLEGTEAARRYTLCLGAFEEAKSRQYKGVEGLRAVVEATDAAIEAMYSAASASFGVYAGEYLHSTPLGGLLRQVRSAYALTRYRLDDREGARAVWRQLASADRLDRRALKNLAVCDSYSPDVSRRNAAWRDYVETLYLLDAVMGDVRANAAERARFHRNFGGAYAPLKLHRQLHEFLKEEPDADDYAGFLSSVAQVRCFVDNKLLETANRMLEAQSPTLSLGLDRSEVRSQAVSSGKIAKRPGKGEVESAEAEEENKTPQELAKKKYDAFFSNVSGLLPGDAGAVFSVTAKRRTDRAIVLCANRKNLLDSPLYRGELEAHLKFLKETVETKYKLYRAVECFDGANLAKLRNPCFLTELARLDAIPLDVSAYLIEPTVRAFGKDATVDWAMDMMRIAQQTFAVNLSRYLFTDAPAPKGKKTAKAAEDGADVRNRLYKRMMGEWFRDSDLEEFCGMMDNPSWVYPKQFMEACGQDSPDPNALRPFAEAWMQRYPETAGVLILYVNALLNRKMNERAIPLIRSGIAKAAFGRSIATLNYLLSMALHNRAYELFNQAGPALGRSLQSLDAVRAAVAEARGQCAVILNRIESKHYEEHAKEMEATAESLAYLEMMTYYTEFNSEQLRRDVKKALGNLKKARDMALEFKKTATEKAHVEAIGRIVKQYDELKGYYK